MLDSVLDDQMDSRSDRLKGSVLVLGSVRGLGAQLVCWMARKLELVTALLLVCPMVRMKELESVSLLVGPKVLLLDQEMGLMWDFPKALWSEVEMVTVLGCLTVLSMEVLMELRMAD